MARIVLSSDSQPVPNMTTCALVMFTNTQQMHLVQYLTDFRNKVFIRHKNLVLEIASTSRGKGKGPLLAVCYDELIRQDI